MPRDTDKNNSARGRRDRPGGGKAAGGGRSGGGKGGFGAKGAGGKGRSGAARGPEKKFAKRAAGGGDRPYAKKSFDGEAKRSFGPREGGEKRAYTPRPPRDDRGGDRPFKRDDRAPRRDFAERPRRDDGDAPRPRFNRDERPARGGDRPERGPRKEFGDKRSFGSREGGEKRAYTPRPPRDDRGGDRPFKRDDRAPRRDRDDARPAGRFGEKKFGDKPFGDRKPREGGDKRPYQRREDGDKRPFTPRDGDKKFGRGAPDRGPRKSFGDRPERGADRGNDKPWQKRDSAPAARGERSERGRGFDKPRSDRPRSERPREDRGGERPRFGRDERPKFERRERGGDWHEHPRSEARSFDRPRSEGRGFDRPRRDNEDDSKVFAKRPAFGGRGAYRERPAGEHGKFDKKAGRGKPDRRDAKASNKPGDRIAKVVARAGMCSRRDAEAWITDGRVTVNGKVIDSPALDVLPSDVITIDGKPLPERERTRLFLYHKPRGLMTTHADPEGRPTVFDHLPEDLPRLISIGRLDFNTEGLLLLTNDGGLARALELPETGWLRRYRVRAHGEVTQAQLDELKNGIEVDGVKYGEIDARLERDQGANVWLVFAIREGKNREVRNVLAHLGLEVNRLIRVSYGPFQLLELGEGEVEEVKTRVLREQLGEKIIELAGCDFVGPSPSEIKPKRPARVVAAGEAAAPAPKKKAVTKRGAVEDRKGRRIKVERTSAGEPRDPSRGPARRYHGKRDAAPREE
ncbi:pseudouridine synthase [Rhodopseudomonas sp. AAP120]|uniref:pseudouridine synthase n=1 Tax=Rhodopseudomonas sp. AAP120 TaxID=1523430 RepID=UPI0006B9250E|nr:pseudouridine synthase [Rhodopseudomonas sp. AAP120]KPF96577.1 pseudouridine synthase [Rhodopseudomonas sp. AAP120]